MSPTLAQYLFLKYQHTLTFAMKDIIFSEVSIGDKRYINIYFFLLEEVLLMISKSVPVTDIVLFTS